MRRRYLSPLRMYWLLAQWVVSWLAATAMIIAYVAVAFFGATSPVDKHTLLLFAMVFALWAKVAELKGGPEP